MTEFDDGEETLNPISGASVGKAVKFTMVVEENSSLRALYRTFSSQGFSLDDLALLLMADQYSAKRLKSLPRGQTLELFAEANGRVSMVIVPEPNGMAHYFTKEGEGFAVEHTDYVTVLADDPLSLSIAGSAQTPFTASSGQVAESGPRPVSSATATVSDDYGDGEGALPQFESKLLVTALDTQTHDGEEDAHIAQQNANAATDEPPLAKAPRAEQASPATPKIPAAAKQIRSLSLTGLNSERAGPAVTTPSAQINAMGLARLDSDQMGNAEHIAPVQIMDAGISDRSLLLDDNALETAQDELDVLIQDLSREDESASPDYDDAPGGLYLRSVAISKGDTLYSIYQEHGLPQGEFDRLMSTRGKDIARLTTLRPGETLDFLVDEQNKVEELVYHFDESRALHATRDGDRYIAEIRETPLERRVVTAAGRIVTSLYADGREAGLSDEIVTALTRIFAWDIDFALDIQVGDAFAVVYEQFYRNGTKVKDGDILGAEFVNHNQTFRAIGFETADGERQYYTPEGLSLRKAFLSTPVKYTRISSRFDLRRRHPVLHKIRAHKGVDYSAPTGTPVKAAGDGQVISAGRKGGYGKTVVLKHGKKYTTLYGHLSRIAKGLKANQRVRQGQVIGYVGKTGLATGPHLHYELRVDGVHRDPLKVKRPRAEPVGAEDKERFLSRAEELRAQLDALAPQTLAASP